MPALHQLWGVSRSGSTGHALCITGHLTVTALPETLREQLPLSGQNYAPYCSFQGLTSLASYPL